VDPALESAPEAPAKALVGRQFLRAWRLGFRLPASDRYQEFESPLPEDLAGALEALGGTG
jgi:hypothetical protein